MKLIPKSHDIKEYLKADAVIDYDDKSVSRLADTLYERSEDRLDYIRIAYEYVRDRIEHSADINAEEVPCSASEVLKAGHGICFAKSHLLAALLRYKGIPTGFCYQKLILDDETAPELIIHGLNGVYLEDRKIWIRLDARGNKEGVNAGFSVTEEELAFPVRPEKGEKDGVMVYADPDNDVLMALQSHKNRSELWADLPTELPDANEKNCVIRLLQKNETELLKDFLYEAIFIPEGVEPPAREIIEQPELKLYYDGFGTGRADFSFVADIDGKVVGAVWTRIMNDYGHVDDETPSFAISLYKEYRGLGIGTRMMKEMLKHLKEKGYKRASLAVQKANYAVRMYQNVGFKIVDENTEEYIMLGEL